MLLTDIRIGRVYWDAWNFYMVINVILTVYYKINISNIENR